MNEFGVAIVGYGFIGRVHALAYVSVPWTYPGAARVRMVGAATATARSAEAAQPHGGFQVVTTNYRELVERDDVHIVSVCTPNDKHREVTLAALRAGKHVYCDKPLGLDVAEAEEMTAAAADAGVVAQVTLQYRYVPAIRRAHQLVTEGRIGRVHQFRVAYLHSGYVDPQRAFSWRMDWGRSGGGAVSDLGVHAIDLARLLLGDFESVTATQRTFIPQRPAADGSGPRAVTVDDLTLAQAVMQSGAVGTMEFSRLVTGAEDELLVEVYGDRGALRFNLMQPDHLDYFDVGRGEGVWGGDRGWQRIAALGRYPEAGALHGAKATQGWMRFHVAAMHDFLEGVRAGRLSDYAPTFADGLAAQKVVAALQRSAQSGRWESAG